MYKKEEGIGWSESLLAYCDWGNSAQETQLQRRLLDSAKNETQQQIFRALIKKDLQGLKATLISESCTDDDLFPNKDFAPSMWVFLQKLLYDFQEGLIALMGRTQQKALKEMLESFATDASLAKSYFLFVTAKNTDGMNIWLNEHEDEFSLEDPKKALHPYVYDFFQECLSFIPEKREKLLKFSGLKEFENYFLAQMNLFDTLCIDADYFVNSAKDILNPYTLEQLWLTLTQSTTRTTFSRMGFIDALLFARVNGLQKALTRIFVAFLRLNESAAPGIYGTMSWKQLFLPANPSSESKKSRSAISGLL